MKHKAKWAILVALAILAYGLAVFWFWYSIPLPYEKPPAPTKSELKIMEKSRYKHGDYTQIITAEAIYLERKGKGGKLERVWIARERRRK